MDSTLKIFLVMYWFLQRQQKHNKLISIPENFARFHKLIRNNRGETCYHQSSAKELILKNTKWTLYSHSSHGTLYRRLTLQKLMLSVLVYGLLKRYDIFMKFHQRNNDKFFLGRCEAVWSLLAKSKFWFLVYLLILIIVGATK